MPPSALEELVEQLHRASDEHQLIARAHAGFQAWIDEATDDDVRELPEGWSYSEMSAEFKSIALCFRSAHLSYPYFDTQLRIVRSGVDIGYYRLLTRLSGEDDDDYFVIHAANRR
jgi:hypothetical protein